MTSRPPSSPSSHEPPDPGADAAARGSGRDGLAADDRLPAGDAGDPGNVGASAGAGDAREPGEVRAPGDAGTPRAPGDAAAPRAIAAPRDASVAGLAPDEPVPVRTRLDPVAAGLDVARLDAAGIPARAVEPDGPSGDGRRRAVVLVPAGRRDEAMRLLAEDRAVREDAGNRAAGSEAAPVAADGRVAAAEPSHADDQHRPYRPRPMPLLARIGLVFAVLLLLVMLAGALVTLLIGP